MSSTDGLILRWTRCRSPSVLLRLLIGESREALLRDDDLVLMISLAAPKPGSQ